MTRFSDLSPAWGKQGNSVYLSVPEKAGCLSLSKTASFTLRTMSFHVFMGTWNPAKTHEWETRPNSPWPVYTSPCQKWGSFRGVSAPLPSGLQAYVIFFFLHHRRVKYSLFYGTLHDIFQNALLKNVNERKTNIFKRKKKNLWIEDRRSPTGESILWNTIQLKEWVRSVWINRSSKIQWRVQHGSYLNVKIMNGL